MAFFVRSPFFKAELPTLLCYFTSLYDYFVVGLARLPSRGSIMWEFYSRRLL